MFICLRGIPKIYKSRKVRLLHHIYLFLRVIEESTYIYQQETRPPLGFSLPDKKMMFPSLRTHSLHVGRDLDAYCGGDFEIGLLGETEDVGSQQVPSLFEQIYGIPEMLLSFISRTSSLANQIDGLRNHSHGPTLTDQQEVQCQTLENEICHWNSNIDGLVDNADGSILSANRAILPHLVIAIHSAVIIFFYRRIRRLNPLLLQPHARKVILNLEQAEQKKLGLSVANTGIVWPGFIAAAETTEPDLQERAYKLLRNCARTSGLRNFDVASDFLHDLWTIRRHNGDSNISWVNLVRDRKSALILT
jgi:arginine metabolism regulation protein II